MDICDIRFTLCAKDIANLFFAKCLDIEVVAFRRAIAHWNDDLACLSVDRPSLSSAPKTSSVSLKPSKPAESLIGFTAIFNASSFSHSKHSF